MARSSSGNGGSSGGAASRVGLFSQWNGSAESVAYREMAEEVETLLTLKRQPGHEEIRAVTGDAAKEKQVQSLLAKLEAVEERMHASQAKLHAIRSEEVAVIEKAKRERLAVLRRG